MTYGNRNPRPTPNDEDEPFVSVRVGEAETLYGVPLYQFTVRFAAADFADSDVSGVDVTMQNLADALNEVGFTLQARELRAAASEFANSS